MSLLFYCTWALLAPELKDQVHALSAIHRLLLTFHILTFLKTRWLEFEETWQK